MEATPYVYFEFLTHDGDNTKEVDKTASLEYYQQGALLDTFWSFVAFKQYAYA